jgi:TRAP-type C4-dicarboxylate transport system permease small subunit
MKTRRITKTITTSLCFFVFMVLIIACDTGNGMMHGNNSMGMNNLNWTQILIGLGVVCLIGFIIWVVISKRK